jgi:hypothetical protein
VKVLERLTRVAPLGVRLWDPATGRAVTDGIVMRETASGATAFANGAGVLVATGLRGLREAEFGVGDGAYWAALPATADFTFEVTDERGRFVDFRFTVTLPHRGLFVPSCLPVSPLDGLADSIPLFSAPGRSVPGGLAVVRAELWDVAADAPAARAVLEVTPPQAPPVVGIADDEGRAVVLLPYPEPPWQGGASPPPGSLSLAEQSWTVGVAVRFDSPPLGGPARPAPDLCAVLGQQPATALADLSPPTDLTQATLEYGRDLVLRTAGESTLHLEPAP